MWARLALRSGLRNRDEPEEQGREADEAPAPAPAKPKGKAPAPAAPAGGPRRSGRNPQIVGERRARDGDEPSRTGFLSPEGEATGFELLCSFFQKKFLSPKDDECLEADPVA